jgi:TRAP-type uncharacterized transport system fused permease subunit
MGDITPPVGLATFAAAAISGGRDETGIRRMRCTVILPFIWIFNPALLLIGSTRGPTVAWRGLRPSRCWSSPH